ncbi:hypothetical protein ACP275_02G073800 [Erythranthe tilingii]
MEQVPQDSDDVAAASASNCRSTVDTSRPFRSVKEAVAIFGERFLVGEIYTPRVPFAFPKKETPFFSPSPKLPLLLLDHCHKEEPASSNYTSLTTSPRFSSYYNTEPPPQSLSETVRKLELELEDTKAELNLLKERESETEVEVASLNAELHRNMSKLARAEAAAAGKAAADGGGGAMVIREEEKKRDAYLKMERGASPSLAQILSFGEKDNNQGSLFVGRKKKEMVRKKKKPIIPLVGELFFWRKKGKLSTTTLHNPLYSSSHLQWN